MYGATHVSIKLIALDTIHAILSPPDVLLPLITGLLVTCNSIIKSILGHIILNMSSDDCWRLQLEKGALSVIHYPSADSPPLLQSINISDAAMSSILSTGVKRP